MRTSTATTNAAIAHADACHSLESGKTRMLNSCSEHCFSNAHRYADAVAPFTSTTRLRPKFGPAYVNLCVAQRELKLLDEALANCEQGARLSPTKRNRGST